MEKPLHQLHLRRPCVVAVGDVTGVGGPSTIAILAVLSGRFTNYVSRISGEQILLRNIEPNTAIFILKPTSLRPLPHPRLDLRDVGADLFG